MSHFGFFLCDNINLLSFDDSVNSHVNIARSIRNTPVKLRIEGILPLAKFNLQLYLFDKLIILSFFPYF